MRKVINNAKVGGKGESFVSAEVKVNPPHNSSRKLGEMAGISGRELHEFLKVKTPYEVLKDLRRIGTQLDAGKIPSISYFTELGNERKLRPTHISLNRTISCPHFCGVLFQRSIRRSKKLRVLYY